MQEYQIPFGPSWVSGPPPQTPANPLKPGSHRSYFANMAACTVNILGGAEQ